MTQISLMSHLSHQMAHLVGWAWWVCLAQVAQSSLVDPRIHKNRFFTELKISIHFSLAIPLYQPLHCISQKFLHVTVAFQSCDDNHELANVMPTSMNCIYRIVLIAPIAFQLSFFFLCVCVCVCVLEGFVHVKWHKLVDFCSVTMQYVQHQENYIT
jgi:hypothetical protein